MKLRPIDFSILDVLLDGRNVAANIHIEIDSSRQYVNERMGILRDYGLVKRVGPNPNSGLYEVTRKGRLVLEHRERYNESPGDFDEFIEDLLGDTGARNSRGKE